MIKKQRNNLAGIGSGFLWGLLGLLGILVTAIGYKNWNKEYAFPRLLCCILYSVCGFGISATSIDIANGQIHFDNLSPVNLVNILGKELALGLFSVVAIIIDFILYNFNKDKDFPEATKIDQHNKP
jgi:hypothetical protein